MGTALRIEASLELSQLALVKGIEWRWPAEDGAMGAIHIAGSRSSQRANEMHDSRGGIAARRQVKARGPTLRDAIRR